MGENKYMKSDICVRVHFQNLGWVERDNGDVLWFRGLRLEALQIKADKKINFAVKNKVTGEWMYADEANIAGKVSCANEVTDLKFENNDMYILLRVYYQSSGWTDFYINENSDAIETERIEGIQLYICRKADTPENIKDILDEKLRLYREKEKNIYCRYKNKFLEKVTKNYCYGDKAAIQVIDGGIILPLKLIEKSRDGIYSGGGM